MPARQRESLPGARRRSNDYDERRSPLTLRQSSSLTQQIQSIVPSCAQPCLEIYLNQDSQGYTLGELAFVCLRKDCPSPATSVQQSVYGICSAQAGEVLATHSTLTLPATTTSSSDITTTTVQVYVTSSGDVSSSTMSSPTTLRTSASGSSSDVSAVSGYAMTIASSTAASTSALPTAMAVATAASSSESTSLTSGQAVGVSVAAFGGLGVAVALIWIFACWRRRKGKGICKSPPSQHDSYDFLDDAPPRFSPFRYGYADPRGPLGGFTGQRVELPDDKRAKSQWYREQFPVQEAPEKLGPLGIAVNRTVSPESLRSVRSNGTLRTISQLLPDKPGETPPRPSQKQCARTQPSARSPETVFEEYASSRPSSKRISTTLMPPVPTHAALLRGKGAIQGTQCAQQHPTAAPDEIEQPSLSLTMPIKASRPVKNVPSPIRISPPPAPRSAHGKSRDARTKSGTSSKSGGSLLEYYTSPEIDMSMNALGSPFTPISLEPQRRIKPIPAAITVTRPTYPPRAVRRTSSAGSDTSFESTDPDEPTPPDEEDKQLSPVAEHSPIAAIRYPKVPRSSNQSIPRSPVMRLAPPKSPRRHRPKREEIARNKSTPPTPASQPALQQHTTPIRPTTTSPSLTGSTLATASRRLESNASTPAGSSEKRLYIDTSHSRANSHVRAPNQPPIGAAAATPPPLPRLSATAATTSAGRQDSPLKGYGRVTSSSAGGGRYSRSAAPNTASQQTPEMKTPGSGGGVRFAESNGAGEGTGPLRSPLWEPKLTPRRRGEDLFLEVGLASPGVLTPGPMSGRW
ncbi:hypothetical protein LTR01_003788 [Friedmanniomyces endolithicus]|nr:hypothetical protein LTR01_003788 [Friedmanniomyces endolithicus]KAK0835730.1 hypothetical protein LTR73_000229 [Friedmanniomyces endolithicus]